MLDEDDPNVKAAILGKLTEEFLKSDVGEYLVSMAELQVNEAVEELKRVSVWRKNRIKTLQNQIWVAESFQKWLGNAYSEGIRAMDELEQR